MSCSETHWRALLVRVLLVPILTLAFPLGHLRAEIYQWQDSEGRVHFGDSDSKADGAERIEVPAVNSLPPPRPQEPPPQTTREPQHPPPTSRLTPSAWASRYCRLTVRVLYTDYWLVPCLPTNEVTVYICQRESPAKYRGFFGTRYRYQDIASECGAEVFEGEILYLKK